MKPLDLKALLGGYAAGTLTAQERELLFQAALDDQALFDALADEEALRELLADPTARAQLLSDLREEPEGFWDRLGSWLWKPAAVAFAGSAIALVLVVGVVRYARQEPPAPKLVAQAPAAVESAPAPAVVVREKAQKETRPRGTEPPRQVAAMPALSAEKAAAGLRDEAPAALSYSVQVQDPSGDWRDTPPGARFRGGDRVRLRVRSAEDGYILLTAVDGPALRALTPGTGVPVKSGQDLFAPASGALELDGISGQKTLRLSFSIAPLPAPAATFRFAQRTSAPAAGQKAEAEKPLPADPRELDIRIQYGPQ